MRLAFAARLTLVVMTTFVAGCSGGKGPFRMVQFCLSGVEETPVFTSFMNEIAQENGMEFTDRSAQSGEELRSLASENKNVPVNARAVNISANRGNAFSFGASNLGLPSNQIVIGFDGSSIQTAQLFADAVVKKLSSRWKVHEVPQEQGASPLSRCD